MKIIAFYLPQFHNIPENDKWWGDGFTEWTNVKKAKPLFEGHEQPKIPLNNNYYNLLDDDVKIWQANLAKKYGIYGFCYYHYWFNGKMLLEKPMEQMLKNKKIDIPFCICWANEAWTKRWIGQGNKALIKQYYGNEKEWINHYEYLKKFFYDNRYIYDNGKPMIVIYRAEIIPCIREMLECWEKCAKKDGFKGLTTVCVIREIDKKRIGNSVNYFNYSVNWEPSISGYQINNYNNIILRNIKNIRRKLINILSIKLGVDIDNYSLLSKIYSKIKKNDKYVDFKIISKRSLERQPIFENNIPGGFIRIDNSPRYGIFGGGTINENPKLFKEYLKKLIFNAKYKYKKNYIFFYAWNEWAEGGFLEPDEKYKYEYLQALKDALIFNNEFPIR